MKYYKQVSELLECYPGREFKKEHFVNLFVKRGIGGNVRARINVGVHRVLQALIAEGFIESRVMNESNSNNGKTYLYQWKLKP